MIVTCITPMVRVLKKTHDFIPQDEDIYLGVKQLSQYTMGTYYLGHGNEYHYLNCQEEEVSIVLDNHRLVKKPGYEILICHIDDVSFEVKDKWVYINLTRNERHYSFLMAYQKEKKLVNEEDNLEQ